jgi:hypothetical protein
MIVGAAYVGLEETWGANPRKTIFGELDSVYAALIPYDGYCRTPVGPSTVPPADPCRAGGLPLAKDECFAARYGVTVGMTPEQIGRLERLPKRIEEKPLDIGGRKTVQWRYETFSHYFENGVLYAIQQY